MTLINTYYNDTRLPTLSWEVDTPLPTSLRIYLLRLTKLLAWRPALQLREGLPSHLSVVAYYQLLPRLPTSWNLQEDANEADGARVANLRTTQ